MTKRRMNAMLAGLLAIASLAIAADDDPWRRDLDALQQGLARHYANFEDLLTERRLDLPALAARDRAALAAARNDAERRGVFERLLRDLRDPHVRIEWPAGDAAAAADTARPVCDPDMLALGSRPGLAFRRLPGWTALDGAAAQLFAAGVLAPPGGVPVGVLRVPVFIESAFEPACRHAAAAMQRAPSDPCDDTCAERRDRLAAAHLDDALRHTLQALEAAGARRLAVDVTNNPGGSDWSEAVARRLAGPMDSARVAMLRHPAWLAWIDKRQADATPDDARILQRLRPQVSQVCDLSAAWTDSALATGRRALPCSTLVDGGLHTQGFSPSGPGPALPAASALPLSVLIDGDTHSAAEQFAAMLQDHRRATLLGAVSAGAGCGHYTGGEGTSFTLPASGARVRVPDCVRLRADGSNERRGVVPDRLLPWAPSDSAWQRAAKAAAALSASAAAR
jgi:hypothetical protein